MFRLDFFVLYYIVFFAFSISSYVDYLLVPFACISTGLPFFLPTYRRFTMH